MILSFAALMLMPFALIIDRPWTMEWDLGAAISIMYLGMFPTGIAMFMILHLIAVAGASFLVFNNYLVPAVGVLISFIVLGEVPQPNALVALVIILCGIAASQLRFGRTVTRTGVDGVKGDPIAPVLDSPDREKASLIRRKNTKSR